jgi:hypothetical protein
VLQREEYAVYSGRERPPMGRDLQGRLFFQCFTITLERHKDYFMPYRFLEFIADYTKRKGDVCLNCIRENARLEWPEENSSVDRSAVDRKFFGANNEIDKRDYYYCPRIGEILDASKLRAQPPDSDKTKEPIHAILKGNWDDEYLFEFLSIGTPKEPSVCAIHRELFASQFMQTAAEKAFMRLWFMAMYLEMDGVRSRSGMFLEHVDFKLNGSRFFRFLLPIPQVWVKVNPKPMSRNSPTFADSEVSKTEPQRVDFLLIYKGLRHVIEIDGVGHYGEQTHAGSWQASESRYRGTLAGTRALEAAGYKVHRFTNEEILGLQSGSFSEKQPDTGGFIELLKSTGLEPKDMVFIPDVSGQGTSANQRPAADGRGRRGDPNLLNDGTT